MDSSNGAGFMAVFAVSGSVVFLALQLHKRLLSDFFKQMQVEIGSTKSPAKKKSNTSNAKAVQPDGKAAVRKMHRPPRPPTGGRRGRSSEEKLDNLPLNWQILYKGIIEYKNSALNL